MERIKKKEFTEQYFYVSKVSERAREGGEILGEPYMHMSVRMYKYLCRDRENYAFHILFNISICNALRVFKGNARLK